MTSFSDWPALRFDGGALPEVLHYERGVFGKVHGASSDFRWIARTAHFAADGADPERQVNLGGEDMPSRFQAWRCLGDRYLAVNIYPSRATDAAGRRGFLEKQVLEWQRPAEVPAAAGALLLLPHIAAMSDAVWWDRLAEQNWSQSDAYLPIPDADRAPLAVDEDRLAIALERGRQALRETVGSAALTQMYDQILSGRRPAFLAGLTEPLPPEAVAALLLALPREIADRISVAGWVPSSRPSLPDLAARWDVLVAPLSPPAAMVAQPSERAWAMAEDLLAFEPGLISLVSDEMIIDDDSVAEPAALSAPAAAQNFWRPDEQLVLTPPDAGAAATLLELYEFARSARRRWLDVATVPRPGTALRQTSARVLVEWVQQVCKPPYANEEQWSVKVDLLRSAALALVPDASTVRAIGIPNAGSHVPALLFALLLNNRERDVLLGLGEPALREAIVQSLTCRGARRYESKMRQWLQDWLRVTSREQIKSILQHALRAHAA